MLLFLAVVIGMWSVFSTTRFFPLILLTVVARKHTWIEVFTEEALERGKVFSAQERGSGFQLADGFTPEVTEALYMLGFFEALNCGGSRSGGGGSYGRDPLIRSSVLRHRRPMRRMPELRPVAPRGSSQLANVSSKWRPISA